MTSKATNAIGIDIGSDNLRVAVYKNGTVDDITDQGHPVTPAYVAFTDTEILVGHAAKDQRDAIIKAGAASNLNVYIIREPEAAVIAFGQKKKGNCGQMKALVQSALEKAQLEKSEIDDILIVGDSTRIQVGQALLVDFLEKSRTGA
ncbi:70-kilodalton heat shock protein [Globodera pallida]|nr:70-kilodalton heat shock protein [Globodera pallida]